MPTAQRARRVTYFSPPPVRIGDTLVRSPLMRSTRTPGTNEAVVDRAPRRPLQVGHVVTVSVPRTTRFSWPEIGLPRGWLDRGTRVGVVTDISPNGRLLKIRSLIPERSYAISGDGMRLTPRSRSRLDAATDRFTTVPTGEPYDADELRNLAERWVDCPYLSIARSTHVRYVWGLDELPEGLLQALQHASRRTATRAMWDRLHEAGVGGRVDRWSWMKRTSRVRSLQTLDTRTRGRQVASCLLRGVAAYRNGDERTAKAHLGYALSAAHDSIGMVRRAGGVSDAFSKKLRANFVSYFRKQGITLFAADCGHFHFDEHQGNFGPRYAIAVALRDAQYVPVMGSLCITCASAAREAEWPSGATLLTNANAVGLYHWSDGIYRLKPEPHVIGGYHSSKEVVGAVAPLVPRAPGWPSIGFELEVEMARAEEARETHAKAIRKLVRELPGFETEGRARKYLNFENDGSLRNGFELVSGWTDLDTHRTIMHHVLVNEEGKNRWVGKLKSHNTTTCGLHVHIVKPKSLVHAAKVRYFMSADIFRELIKAVARRWNTDYANVANYSGEGMAYDVKPEKAAAYYAKRQGVKYAARAMMLNSSRYEHVNYHNSQTIEFRVYKGTTVFTTFMACLEMTQAVWFYCRDTPATAMTVESFLRYIERPEHSKDTVNLRNLLSAKGFIVRVAKPPKGTTAIRETAEV